ncbi:zinc ribbon domain-containing protein [Sphaerisporangium fuscum]|uniref:zinc ribbon domain-containing protein n=1 Tax=Sphaerisporangium fuscum TaxID=2835868 RepID=UPI001BDD7CEC|nr:zinc ribbon domain-containing protein [Sphaerisporangium fuscum]
MPLAVLLGVAVWAVCMYFGFLYGFPVACAVTVVAATAAGLAHYMLRATRILLPATAEGLSPAVPGDPDAGRDPAYRHYLFTQASRDWWQILRAAVPAMIGTAGLALRTATRWLMGGYQGLFLVPIWLAMVVGLVLTLLPLAGLGAGLAAAYGVVTAVGTLLWLACVLALRGAEQAFMLVRRILQTCPHPQCYARIALPEYACPTCGERHRRLIPNQDGAFRHVCRCGTRLPTAIVLGRFRLQAYCPNCGRALPPRIGRVRIEPLPFVGGPDAGKTTFMVLAISALHRAVKAASGRAGFVVRGDEIAFARSREELRAGKVAKTTTAAPSATMVDVTLPGSRSRSGNRLLYLFDPSGEGFTGAAGVEEMSYLAHTEAMLIVVDPFALPLVQQGLSPGERDELRAAGVVLSPEDPADTFQRVRNELAAREDGGRQKRVAVVVTKADLLRRTAVGQDCEHLPGWFDGVGLGNMVRDLAKTAGEVRYLASGLPADDAAIVVLLAWLTGLPLASPPPAEDAEVTTADLREPWAGGRVAEGRAPLGYRLFRWSIFALSVVVGAGTLALSAAVAFALVTGFAAIW